MKFGDAMFPEELDGAKVLFYTPQGDYGAIQHPNGEIVDHYRYLAICKYADDDAYYLFCCNENYEVVNDWLDGSIAACKNKKETVFHRCIILNMDTIDFTIQVAGQVVGVTAMHENTKNYCEKYLCDGKPQFSVTITPEDLHSEQEACLREDALEGHSPCSYTDTYLEPLAVQRKITEHLFEHNTLLFHGSTVAVDGEAYLFIAKSGTGKSTHTRLWRQLLGDRAVMVNDDKPFLEIRKDGVIAHGSPWNGAHKLGNNICVPLKAICILERGDNQIQQICSKDSLFMLLQQSCRPRNSALLPKYMELLDVLSKNVKFYKLQCNVSIEAARMAYETMSK